MAYWVSVAEIQKARDTAERALQVWFIHENYMISSLFKILQTIEYFFV
jgi:hypothetical protein